MINIVKSQPSPACLEAEKRKANGDYKCGEVLVRTQTDFHNKCYICEEKAITSINVEHFKAHKGDKDLKFDWNNLFFACYHCNNTKKDSIDVAEIEMLNCISPDHKILEWMKFDMVSFPKEKVIITAMQNDEMVGNTVKLLDNIYNGTTPLKKLESSNLRQKLLMELNRFSALIANYYSLIDGVEKESLKAEIIIELNPDSAFTAFKAWYILNNENLKQEFEAFLPQ